jgi:hypothetical protein
LKRKTFRRKVNMEQGCQMIYFKTKIPIWAYVFWRALEWKMLEHFTPVWYNFWPFGIIYGRLV